MIKLFVSKNSHNINCHGLTKSIARQLYSVYRNTQLCLLYIQLDVTPNAAVFSPRILINMEIRILIVKILISIIYKEIRILIVRILISIFIRK
jgi:hypothetical protein